jgi:hypothetical protein
MSPEVQKALNMDQQQMRGWLRAFKDDELDEFIENCSAASTAWQYGIAARERRSGDRLARPHLVAYWALVVAILSMIFAGIAARPVIRSWLP